VTWDAALIDANGLGKSIAMREVGLGRYEAGAPLGDRTNVSLRVRDADHDKMTLLHWHRPYPNEYRLARETPPAIAALRPASTHSIIDDPKRVMRRESIAHYAYFGALACMLGSILLRRL
jgi:hypothetical protein